MKRDLIRLIGWITVFKFVFNVGRGYENYYRTNEVRKFMYSMDSAKKENYRERAKKEESYS